MNPAKTTAYTPEQTQQVIAMYQGGQDPQAIADLLGKTRRSIIAKLAREGVYQAQPQKTPRLKKTELVEQIAQRLGIEEDNLQTLEQAQHSALEALLKALDAEQVAQP